MTSKDRKRSETVAHAPGCRRLLEVCASAMLSFALITGCGETADEPENPSHGGGHMSPAQGTTHENAPTLTGISGSSFKVTHASTSSCGIAELSAAARTSPSESELSASIGNVPSTFVVLLVEEIDLQQFPLAVGRDLDPASDPTWQARANRIAVSQRCALAAVAAEGGEYLESFVLVNSFTANLTAAQAIALSKRADVRLVELAQTNLPPPGGG